MQTIEVLRKLEREQVQRITRQSISDTVDHIVKRLESNSVSRRDILRSSLLTEQLLLLYEERDNTGEYSVICTRRKHRMDIQLFVRTEKLDLLSSAEDPILVNLVSDAPNPPKWYYRQGCNIIEWAADIPVTGVWNLRFLLPYLKKEKGACIAALLFQAAQIAVSILIPVLTARLITAYTDSEILRILLLAAVLMLTNILCFAFEYAASLFSLRVFNSVRNELETDLSRRLFRLEDACISKYGSGMFIQRMVSDTETIASGFNDVIVCLSYLIQAVGVIVAVGMISPPLCVLFIFSAVLTSVLAVSTMKKKSADDRLFRRERDHYTGFISEMIHGEKDIKLQNSSEQFVEKMSASILKTNRANFNMELKYAQRSLFRKSIKEVCDLIIYAVLALLVLQKKLLPSEAVIVLNYNISIASFCWFFSALLSNINTVSVSSERIFQILYSSDFKEERFGTLCPEEFGGNISFRDVWFSYRHEEGKEGLWQVLKGLNMEITAGEKVAIVGRSGTGKTTIFNLLTGLYQPDAGSILLDGTELEKYSAAFIRENIACVSQNPYIFNMSVRDNLDLTRKGISAEEMDHACKAACIYDDIMAMPQGYDTILGEGGTTLSGGQRQRLAIARCLLRKAKVILLDEATSALDNVTQKDVMLNLGELFSGCTLIIVAHRLSTIENSSRILFLSDGRIVADGSHQQLLENCGEYRALYQAEWRLSGISGT